MKKTKARILIILSIIILSSALVACGDKSLKGDNNGGSSDLGKDIVTFEATVIDDDGIPLVTPVEGSSELRSADKISVSIKTDNTSVYEPGDLIRITYDGRIAESYPAQIWASKIEVIGRNMIMDGYFQIIDDIYNEDIALNDGITMLAVDTSQWKRLSSAEKDILIKILGDQYDLEIIEGTREELCEMGLIDEEELYFKEGILIEIRDLDYKESTNTLSATISKWRSGEGAIGWDVKASYKDEAWEISRDGMWIS